MNLPKSRRPAPVGVVLGFSPPVTAVAKTHPKLKAESLPAMRLKSV